MCMTSSIYLSYPSLFVPESAYDFGFALGEIRWFEDFIKVEVLSKGIHIFVTSRRTTEII